MWEALRQALAHGTMCPPVSPRGNGDRSLTGRLLLTLLAFFFGTTSFLWSRAVLPLQGKCSPSPGVWFLLTFSPRSVQSPDCCYQPQPSQRPPCCSFPMPEIQAEMECGSTLTNCMTNGKLCELSVFPFPPLQNGGEELPQNGVRSIGMRH